MACFALLSTKSTVKHCTTTLFYFHLLRHVVETLTAQSTSQYAIITELP